MSGPQITVNWTWSSKRKSEHQYLRSQWTKMDGKGKFNADNHCIHCCGQEPIRRKGTAFIVNKSQKCSTWVKFQKGQSDLGLFLRQPFNITVIQVYAPTTDAKEAEVEWSHEELQDLLEQARKKDVLFITRDWNAKAESQEILEVTGKFGFGVQNEAGQRLTVLPRKCTGQREYPFPTTQDMTLHMNTTTRQSISKSY